MLHYLPVRRISRRRIDEMLEEMALKSPTILRYLQISVLVISRQEPLVMESIPAVQASGPSLQRCGVRSLSGASAALQIHANSRGLSRRSIGRVPF
jgi:hypothetical protein